MISDWVWLTVAFPLLGFLVNGALALRKPGAKTPVSIVGAGVLLCAFAVALALFVELRLHPPHDPIIVSLWRWLPVGPLCETLAQITTVESASPNYVAVTPFDVGAMIPSPPAGPGAW